MSEQSNSIPMSGQKASNITKFNVPCAFGGQASEVTIYIGNPEKNHHPIFFQSKFIQDSQGGVIPASVMESLEKLQKLAEENGVPFEELCRYALGSIEEDLKKNKPITNDTSTTLSTTESATPETHNEVNSSDIADNTTSPDTNKEVK